MTHTTYNSSGVGIFGIEHPDYAVITPRRPARRRSQPAWKADPATDGQLSFIANLLRDRAVDVLKRTSLELELGRGITKGRAGEIIDELKVAPWAADNATPTNDEPADIGVYEKDGTFYAVREARNSDRHYAYEAVITDTAVRFEFSKGTVYKLADARRLGLDEIEALSLQFSRCFLCGTTLKNKKSKAAGIGPVCRKKI